MSAPILILDMKTDLCITSYWIHIYVTDWSYDAGLKRERGRRFKTHAYKWQHHCKKAQGTQVEGAGNKLRERYMFLSLRDSSSLLNPERGFKVGPEMCRKPQCIPSCAHVAVIKQLLLARRQLSTDLLIRHSLSCWAHWESWCRRCHQKQDGANQLIGCTVFSSKETSPKSVGDCRNSAVVAALAEIIRALWMVLFSPKK